MQLDGECGAVFAVGAGTMLLRYTLRIISAFHGDAYVDN